MFTITKNNLEELVKELSKKFNLIDVRKDNLPAKQYFLPPEEEIFVFHKKSGKTITPKTSEPFILFGLNLRETEALVQLDEIMKTNNPDYFYFQKRNSAIIISLIEEDGPLPHVGIDLILEKLDSSKYKATALSDMGKKIIHPSTKLGARSKLFK